MGSEFIEGVRERLIYLRGLLSKEGSIFIRINYSHKYLFYFKYNIKDKIF